MHIYQFRFYRFITLKITAPNENKAAQCDATLPINIDFCGMWCDSFSMEDKDKEQQTTNIHIHTQLVKQGRTRIVPRSGSMMLMADWAALYIWGKHLDWVYEIPSESPWWWWAGWCCVNRLWVTWFLRPDCVVYLGHSSTLRSIPGQTIKYHHIHNMIDKLSVGAADFYYMTLSYALQIDDCI